MSEYVEVFIDAGHSMAKEKVRLDMKRMILTIKRCPECIVRHYVLSCSPCMEAFEYGVY